MYKLILTSCIALTFTHGVGANETAEIKQSAPKNTLQKNNNIPKTQQGYNLAIDAEFLYWQSTIGGYIYAETAHLNPNNITFPAGGNLTAASLETDQGTAYTPPNSFRPGFRVALSSNPEGTSWGVSAKYLWFYSSNQTTATTSERRPFLVNSSTLFHTIIGEYPDSFYPTKVGFNWNQHYQIADFIAERTYCVNHYLKLTPFVGARGTWQERTFNRTFGYAEPLTVYPTQTPQYEQAPFEKKTKVTNTNWGLGVIAGLSSSWYFDKYFSLYGNFSLSGLWMQQKAAHFEDIVYIGIDTEGAANPESLNAIAPLTTANIDNIAMKISTIKPMFDWALGLRAETNFADDAYYIAIQVGWEAQYWPSQVLLLDTADLSMQGLTAKLEFSF